MRGPLRRGLAATLALLLCATFGLTAGTATAAKKKKKAATTFQTTKIVNRPIPDDVVSAPSPPLDSTITVGKKFKGKVVGDVNVTGIRTVGSGPDAAADLRFILTAPSGRTVLLIGGNDGIGDFSIGPLTLDDDTRTSICDDVVACRDPDATLLRPFAGTANLLGLGAADTGPLSAFNGTRMKGNWTFRVFDEDDVGQTNTLIAWGLKVTAARRVRG